MVNKCYPLMLSEWCILEIFSPHDIGANASCFAKFSGDDLSVARGHGHDTCDCIEVVAVVQYGKRGVCE